MAVTETGHLASREVDDLYRQHGGEVYRYAYAVLGNHADAEDVTQTTFLNAYRSLEQGVRPRKPSNWLLTIASNAIKQRFRQAQVRPHEVELDERIAGSESDDEGPSIGELLTALSKIPPQQRQAIVLREFEGRSYAEIAEILGVTTAALETLLFRARRSLAEELEHQLSCTEVQLAVSKAVDGRLGRKERRRLRDHLAECPDCARFTRLQQRHRSALRGLMLIPDPALAVHLQGPRGSRDRDGRDDACRRGSGSERSRRECRRSGNRARCSRRGRRKRRRRRCRVEGGGGRRRSEHCRRRRGDRRVRDRQEADEDKGIPDEHRAGSAPRTGGAAWSERSRQRRRSREAECAGTGEEERNGVREASEPELRARSRAKPGGEGQGRRSARLSTYAQRSAPT